MFWFVWASSSRWTISLEPNIEEGGNVAPTFQSTSSEASPRRGEGCSPEAVRVEMAQIKATLGLKMGKLPRICVSAYYVSLDTNSIGMYAWRFEVTCDCHVVLVNCWTILSDWCSPWVSNYQRDEGNPGFSQQSKADFRNCDPDIFPFLTILR